MKKIELMAHLIAGYPTDELCLEAARALVSGGAKFLEIQLPFSDPSADGPIISEACTEVLKRHYRTLDGINLIAKIHNEFPNIKIFLMSYGSLIYTPGVENFCKAASQSGVKGLIIPDFPFDSDEGLSFFCKKNGMVNIPVAAPCMSNDRLEKLVNSGFQYIYAALRSGITGSDTIIDSRTLIFLKKLSAGGSKIFGGFGITSGLQSKVLADSVDAVVAGSVFVKTITDNRDHKDKLYEAVKSKAKEISHS